MLIVAHAHGETIRTDEESPIYIVFCEGAAESGVGGLDNEDNDICFEHSCVDVLSRVTVRLTDGATPNKLFRWQRFCFASTCAPIFDAKATFHSVRTSRTREGRHSDN